MEGAIYCTHSDLIEVHFGDQFAFICNGCRKMGYGTCYTCSNASCNYHLHSACKTASPTMSHPFFANQGIFVLEKTILAPTPPPPPPPSPYYSGYNPHSNYNHRGLLANCMCVACGTSVAHGWRYVLMNINGVRTNVFLHPYCMTLPHQNFVQPMLENHINCELCQSKHGVMGWVYVSNGVAVHVKCMEEFLYEEWERRRNYNNNNNNNVPNHGYAMAQERGLGGREWQAVAGYPRQRYGGIVLGVLNTLASIFGFANNMGRLFDQDFWGWMN